MLLYKLVVLAGMLGAISVIVFGFSFMCPSLIALGLALWLCLIVILNGFIRLDWAAEWEYRISTQKHWK
jgi:hypothetical protein